MTKKINRNVKNTAKHLLVNCSSIVKKAMEEEAIESGASGESALISGHSKSFYIETVKKLSDCCSQLVFGKGFSEELPVEEITPETMCLTLNALNYEIQEIRKTIFEYYSKCQIVFGASSDTDGDRKNCNAESIIYFEHRKIPSLNIPWEELRRAVVDTMVATGDENDPDDDSVYSEEEEEDGDDEDE